MSDIEEYPEDNPKDSVKGYIEEYPEGSPEDNRMDSSEIDRLQVNQLVQRYDLARSAVYKRIKALGIKTETVGNKAFINAEQLRLLDELHQFIQAGGNTPEFLELRGIQQTEEEGLEQSSGLSVVQPDLIQLVTVIAAEMAKEIASEVVAEMAKRLQPPVSKADPLAYFRDLEEAARNGWHLKTSEVAEILDLSPSEIQQYGDHFSDAGFVFTNVGYRAGEVAWKVSKPLK